MRKSIIITSICLTIILLIVLTSCASALTLSEITENIKENEEKIILLQETKEKLHITAEALRDEYIDGLDLADKLSEKWMELDTTEQTLCTETDELKSKKAFYEKLAIANKAKAQETVSSNTNTVVVPKVETTSYGGEVYLGEFSSTSYCAENRPHPPCNDGTPLKTFTGGTPIPYQTVAVDPSVIPLGSKLKVQTSDGVIYTVVANDIGGGVKGKEIDMVLPTHNEALQWGRRTVKVWKIS